MTINLLRALWIIVVGLSVLVIINYDLVVKCLGGEDEEDCTS